MAVHSNSTKSIPLTKNVSAIVDAEDFDWLNQWTWTAFDGRRGKYYAARYKKVAGVSRCIYMHRLIMKEPAGLLVDHANGNTLDNRRQNLRVCSKRQNQRNMCKPRHGKSSRFKGVTWDKNKRKWMAKIKLLGTTRTLGRFHDEKEAAIAYNVAATKYFGEFARLNVI